MCPADSFLLTKLNLTVQPTSLHTKSKYTGADDDDGKGVVMNGQH